MNGIRWSVLQNIQNLLDRFFSFFSQNVENRLRKRSIERKIGVTKHPRSLNPRKVKVMVICPISVHFTTQSTRSMHDVACEFREQ